jgi:hypothetical protein
MYNIRKSTSYRNERSQTIQSSRNGAFSHSPIGASPCGIFRSQSDSEKAIIFYNSTQRPNTVSIPMHVRRLNDRAFGPAASRYVRLAVHRLRLKYRSIPSQRPSRREFAGGHSSDRDPLPARQSSALGASGSGDEPRHTRPRTAWAISQHFCDGGIRGATARWREREMDSGGFTGAASTR